MTTPQCDHIDNENDEDEEDHENGENDGKGRKIIEDFALVRIDPKEKLIIMIFPKFEEEKKC